MTAPFDFRELQAEFDREAAQIDLEALAEARRFAASAERIESILMRLLLGTAATCAAVCLIAQLIMRFGP